MHCRIICMNDGMEYTVVGQDEATVEAVAKEKMAELRLKYWEKNRFSFKDEAEYKARCYWHLHDTKVEII